MTPIPTWAIGAVLALVIAALARRGDALSPSGALAAWMAGTAAMGAGWSWATILIGYFTISALLSRYRLVDKIRRVEGRLEKYGARDAVQVAANGGVFTAVAVAHWLYPDPAWKALGAGAIAASASDTWATEIGTLARATPRSILTGLPVPVGTSGGMTLVGLAAGVAGALFVAGMALLVRWPGAASVAAAVGGVAGCLVDSVLGASLQARYWCASCQVETERRRHECGNAASHHGGVRWLGNDAVNAAATLSGAAVGYAVSMIL